MPRTKKQVLAENTTSKPSRAVEVVPFVEVSPRVNLLEINLHREDLNMLVAKINEIIKVLNK